MCNASEGIWEAALEAGMEKGMEKGMEQGERGMIRRMLDAGRTPEAIHEFCGIPVERVKEIERQCLAEA